MIVLAETLSPSKDPVRALSFAVETRQPRMIGANPKAELEAKEEAPSKTATTVYHRQTFLFRNGIFEFCRSEATTIVLNWMQAPTAARLKQHTSNGGRAGVGEQVELFGKVGSSQYGRGAQGALQIIESILRCRRPRACRPALGATKEIGERFGTTSKVWNEAAGPPEEPVHACKLVLACRYAKIMDRAQFLRIKGHGAVLDNVTEDGHASEEEFALVRR